MKNILLVLIALMTLGSCATKVTSENQLTDFQKELVEFYNNTSTSPLNQEEKNNFVGITFYPYQEKYNVKADFTPINDGDVIPFPTSAGKIQYYTAFGMATFTINGQTHSLKIYQSHPIKEEYKDHLFLPFTDDTNGDGTYGGGRYIDLDLTKSFTPEGQIIINFNEAYNPYCAYSKRYNCPIPPGENSLDTRIEAGVTYKK